MSLISEVSEVPGGIAPGPDEHATAFAFAARTTEPEDPALNLETGTDDPETFAGTDQADTIFAAGGGDTLYGGLADDTLDGGAGNDLIFGGEDNDLLTGGLDDDLLFGGIGNDTLQALAGGDDELIGGQGDDRFVIGNSASTVTLTADAGQDTLDLSQSTAGWTLTEGFRGDALSGTSRIVFDVTLLAGGALPVLSSLVGSDSADVVGDYAEFLNGIDLRGGDDQLTATGNNPFVQGSIDGGEGTDLIDLSADQLDHELDLEAGTYADSFGSFILANFENVVGADLSDTLLGTSGSNALDGGGGADILEGRGGDDTLLGGAGEDVIDGGAGDNSLNGGTGLDTLTYASQLDAAFELEGTKFGVTVNLSNTGAQATGYSRDTISEIENVTGTGFSDLIIGDGTGNTLLGSGGGDALFGGGGADVLEGGGGFDALIGGGGADSLFGGTGGTPQGIEGDIVAYFDATGPLVFEFGETISEILPGSSADLLEDTIGDDIEGVAGATNHSNSFLGEALTGLNLFLGGSLGDTFEGGSGVDQIVGLAGDDVMSGNGGGDALVGDAGDDSLFGGAGADVFFFDGNDGNDTIGDLQLTTDVETDLIFFTGGNFSQLGDLNIADTDAGGTAATDTVISYEVMLGGALVQSTITILDLDAETVLAEAMFVFT